MVVWAVVIIVCAIANGGSCVDVTTPDARGPYVSPLLCAEAAWEDWRAAQRFWTIERGFLVLGSCHKVTLTFDREGVDI